jgi:ribosomal protein S18 acetylase RimI-like enzyme
MRRYSSLKTEEANLFDENGVLYQEEGITIKLADESNAEFIHKLYMDVLQMHADELPEVYKSSLDSSFSVSHITDLMAIPSNYFFIGCKDNEPIGYVHTQIRYLAESPSRRSMRCLYICNITVKPDYQKEGYGRRLLQAVEEVAAAEGVKAIDHTVWSFNKGAREFFIKRGFIPLNETMRKSISS